MTAIRRLVSPRVDLILFAAAAVVAAINVALNALGHPSAYQSRVAMSSVLCLIALGLLARPWRTH